MNDNPKRQGGPRGRNSSEPEGNQLYFNFNKYQQSFDKDAFNALIRGQGVAVTHYRAMPDPSGMASRGDTHAAQSKRQSSDGFLYKAVGTMMVFFSNNTSEFNVQIEGMIKHDSAVITMPEKYEDLEEDILIAPYDRLYIKDIEMRVVHTQYVESNTTGTDRLQYPATHVEWLTDSDGIEYKAGQHFEITEEGFIKWTSQERPGFNPKTLRGTIYAIRYRYTPYFIIARLLHEIRVSQVTDPATFERKLERMPYQALVIREHVLSDENRDPAQDIMDLRFQAAPPVGGVTGPNDPSVGGAMGPIGIPEDT